VFGTEPMSSHSSTISFPTLAKQPNLSAHYWESVLQIRRLGTFVRRIQVESIN